LTSADRRSEILADPGFGRYFTDHMIRSDYRAGAWSAIQILPYEPLSLDPSVSCLHYGQLIFEGLKAFRQPDNSIATLRPDCNAARFARECAK
jgi:branched-chain amino acid aminotransferase